MERPVISVVEIRYVRRSEFTDRHNSPDFNPIEIALLRKFAVRTPVSAEQSADS